jgi:hypothetical protein
MRSYPYPPFPAKVLVGIYWNCGSGSETMLKAGNSVSRRDTRKTIQPSGADQEFLREATGTEGGSGFFRMHIASAA